MNARLNPVAVTSALTSAVLISLTLITVGASSHIVASAQLMKSRPPKRGLGLAQNGSGCGVWDIAMLLFVSERTFGGSHPTS